MANLAPLGVYQAFDSNGDPLSGGKLYTYDAGTVTPKATYTNSSGGVANTNPVILDAAGRANVWLGDGGYKFILKNSADATQFTVDNIGGATDAAFGAVVNDISSNTTITAVYQNTANICTGNITLTLLPAASAGEGFYFTVRNQGTNTVTIDPDASETIDKASTKSIVAGESCLIISDGDEWYTLFLTANILPLNNTFAGLNTFAGAVSFNNYVALAGTTEMGSQFNETRVTAIASASTTNIAGMTGNFVHITGTTTITAFGTVQAGAERTVVFDGSLTLTHNASSLILPTAANITTQAGDTAIFRSEGAGNWKCIKYTRATGKPLIDSFGGGLLHIQDQKTSGVAGQTLTATTWVTRDLTTEITDEIGSTLSSNTFTLPAGTYWMDASCMASLTNGSRIRLYNVTDAGVQSGMVGMSSASSASNSNNVEACLRGRFTISGTKTFRIEHYSQSGGSGGAAVSVASTVEIYSDIKIWKTA